MNIIKNIMRVSSDICAHVPFPQDSEAATERSEGLLRARHSGEGLIDLPVMAKRPRSNSDKGRPLAVGRNRPTF